MPNLIHTTVKHKTKFLALSLWLGIFVVARLVMVVNDLTFAELADQFVIILRDTWYGPFLFILLYAARPLLFMPGTVLILAAGMVYGLAGLPITLTADILSATIMYVVSRWLISNEPEFEGRAGEFVAFMHRNPFEAVLTMQLAYISTDLISSMAGILQLPLRPFILAVLVGGSVGNTLGVIVGSTIKGSVANGNITIQPEMILVSILILVTTISISSRLRGRNLNADKDKTYATR